MKKHRYEYKESSIEKEFTDADFIRQIAKNYKGHSNYELSKIYKRLTKIAKELDRHEKRLEKLMP